LNSWSVFVLPYIEQSNLSVEYFFVDPQFGTPCGWSDQANIPFCKTQLPLFNCPSTPNQPRWDTDQSNFPANLVHAACGDYAAVSAIKNFVGNACFQLPISLNDNTNLQATPPQLIDEQLAGGMTYNQVTPIVYYVDGTSNTILIAEDAGRSNYYVNGVLQPHGPESKEGGWADPNGNFAIDGSSSVDGSINTINTPAEQVVGSCAMNCSNNSELYSFHPSGCNVVFADGSVHFLRKSMSTCVLSTLVTRAGGEVINSTDY